MGFYGDLRTVTLPDLLRWAQQHERTGVLEIERNGISKRVEFRKGFVGSCSSNEPSSRLGQFLLARGRLDETQLQHLLTLHKAIGRRLGLLLVEMKILSRSELASEVAAKAQETVYGLFDWDDAFFRFDPGATLDPDQIEVNLSVEQLIDEGERRAEKLARIRGAFGSSGIVLVRTAAELPPEIADRPLTRRVCESIDGQRTLAEIVLHTRSTEFLLLQFLHRLFKRGLLEIREQRPVAGENLTLLDKPDYAAPPRSPFDPASNPVGTTSSEADGDGDDHGAETAGDPDAGVLAATRLIEQERFAEAVELLKAQNLIQPTRFGRRLLARAEEGLVRTVHGESWGARTPVLLRDRHAMQQTNPSPEESFLLSLIDGMMDVQSIVWLAPLREVDVLMALERMVGKGMIEFAQESPELERATAAACASD